MSDTSNAEDSMLGMLAMQHALQVSSFGVDPLTLEGQERIDFILWNVYALEDELHELTNEVGWKPWASSRHVNETAATGELVDAWHFMMNILMAIAPRGETPDIVAERFVRGYIKKRLKNAERQRDGYDGVSGKCRACHRDLQEAGVGRAVTAEGGEVATWCAGCGAAVVPSHSQANGQA